MSQSAKARRRSRLTKAALVVGSAAVLNPLPWNASTFQSKYMPLFDCDGDGCFPAAAVDAGGQLNGGLNNSGSITGGCRDGHLGRANTYAQSRCANGWCAYVYAL
jgi:hypothetical protein